jgi:DNA mismatch repair protein MutS
MQEFSTPMMKQYAGIKKQYQDCLLFFRAGDFYELFLEDAFIGAKVLNITLTHKRGGKDGKIPMAGVPYHAVDAYLSKLVKAGYKVAICEQVSLPNKYGIIDREVIRVVTPGTVLDEKALEKKDNNYLISLLIADKTVAMSTADISTGYFATIEIVSDNVEQTLRNELARLRPAECLLPESLYNNPEVLKIIKSESAINISCFQDWETFADNAKQFLKKHFGLTTLESFGIETKPLALQTAAALLGYLQTTQKTTVGHIKKIITYTSDEYMLLDKSTIINLELFSTIREFDTKGSLLSILDQTITAMGGRMLKQWIKKPLLKKEAILQRHDAVEEFLDNSQGRYMIRESLKAIIDLERILSRLSVNIGNARDLVNLKASLQTVLTVKKLLQKQKLQEQSLLHQIYENISPDIQNLIDLIETNILDEPRLELKEGGLIKHNVNPELDKLRKLVGGNKEWILQMEKAERERTGISSLKVRFNQIFGFYIEISKSNLHLVPDNYIRKQTLVNGERFVTPELKEHEEIILTAEEKINQLEYKLYTEVLQQVLSFTKSIQLAAENIAILDCMTTFAEIAEKNTYVRPKILYSGEIHITQGRHPVVEKLLDEMQFVPNDLVLNNTNQQLLLITGPNMAGKSVFIRQVAIIVLMNQIGCFVPAKSANLSIVDRIFVRSGASDVITSGLSTFMVEMVETAHILHHATKNSLIIMDEIGRGTSTYDGISIAWAVAEYLVTHFKIPPKTLFATHYHELQKLADEYPNTIKNFHMAVVEEKGEPVFLHTILPGGASHSFGVAVAKLAGVPHEVIAKANAMLHILEKRDIGEENVHEVQTPKEENMLSTEAIVDKLIHKELENLDIHRITPLEALNTLAELKEKIKVLQTQEKFLEAD